MPTSITNTCLMSNYTTLVACAASRRIVSCRAVCLVSCDPYRKMAFRSYSWFSCALKKVRDNKKLVNITSSSRNYWKANVCGERRSVTLQCASNGEILKFPIVWLRDNCRCPTCYSQALHSRMIPLKDFTCHVLPETVTFCKNEFDEIALNVKWPDHHESVYTLDWLRENNFNEKSQNEYYKNSVCTAEEKITWNSSNFANIIRYFSFETLLHDDLELLKWLVTLNKKGIAIIKGAGSEENLVEKLADRVGFIKKTTYGTIFRVEADENSTNAAYRSTPLELHTDLPYYEYGPSFNILHYVIQSKAEKQGENHLVDGLELCEQIKNYDRAMYDTLANTLIDWTDISKNGDYEMHHVHRAPVICVDRNDNVTRINFSQHQRDAHFGVSIERANLWYTAMNYFIHLALHPKNTITLKMEQGDMLTFDNLRVLHGRAGFTSRRCLIGAYLDADIVNSKTRVLLSKLQMKLSDINDSVI